MSIVDECLVADDATEAAPLIIVSYGKHAPAIFALATIAAVRCRLRITVALRLRIMTIDSGIQVGHAERIGCPLDLRQIDSHTLPRQTTVQERGDHNGRPHDEAQMIGIDSLTANGTILIGMIP